MLLGSSSNFFSNSIINSIKENKLIFSEYFELREINEELIIENTFLKNLKSISTDDKISYKNIDTNYLFNGLEKSNLDKTIDKLDLMDKIVTIV